VGRVCIGPSGVVRMSSGMLIILMGGMVRDMIDHLCRWPSIFALLKYVVPPVTGVTGHIQESEADARTVSAVQRPVVVRLRGCIVPVWVAMRERL
jgi:hypothetical protein